MPISISEQIGVERRAHGVSQVVVSVYHQRCEKPLPVKVDRSQRFLFSLQSLDDMIAIDI